MHSSERALLESCSRTSILSLQGIYSTPLNVLSYDTSVPSSATKHSSKRALVRHFSPTRSIMYSSKRALVRHFCPYKGYEALLTCSRTTRLSLQGV